MRKRYQWTLFILLSFLIVLQSGTVEVFADPQPIEEERAEQLKQLEQVTEQLYQNMQQGNTEDANKKMTELIDTLEGLSFRGLTSVEGIHALAESIMDVRETIARVELDPEQWVITSARLRLAVNSLAHKENALWLQYYKIMENDLSVMNKARAGGNSIEFKKAFISLQSHYDVIRPAAIIQRDPSEMNRFDSWMSYLTGLTQANPWNEETVKEAMRHRDAMLKGLFGRKSDEPVFLPITGYNNPWYWTLLIGGWIVIALIYTGYRKYRANQSITSMREKGDRADSYKY